MSELAVGNYFVPLQLVHIQVLKPKLVAGLAIRGDDEIAVSFGKNLGGSKLAVLKGIGKGGGGAIQFAAAVGGKPAPVEIFVPFEHAVREETLIYRCLGTIHL